MADSTGGGKNEITQPLLEDEEKKNSSNDDHASHQGSRTTSTGNEDTPEIGTEDRTKIGTEDTPEIGRVAETRSSGTTRTGTTSTGRISSDRIRNGTIWTATAHIITAVMGAGVLSLGWSLAQLGWLFGFVAIVSFAVLTGVSNYILCDCYQSKDIERGSPRIPSFLQAATFYLGESKGRICAMVMYIVSSVGNDVAYTIAAATSIREIRRSICYHEQGHKAEQEDEDTIYYLLLFGLVQFVMSQIRNFNDMAWISVVAAIISFVYSGICSWLGWKTIKKNAMGSTRGVPSLDKVWQVFQGLGVIAFAYPYSTVLLEIQDTLRSPPEETTPMRTASNLAIVITTVVYLVAGGFGYAAFGDKIPDNLLTGFGFYDDPCWVVVFANALVVAHLICGYQVFSQPIFAFAEEWFTQRYPQYQFMDEYFHPLNLPFLQAFRVKPLRLCFGFLYVMITTAMAFGVPYFNQVLAVLGALSIWPLTIYFPLEMYLKNNNSIAQWTPWWVFLKTISFICCIVWVLVLIGSLQGLISEIIHSLHSNTFI